MSGKFEVKAPSVGESITEVSILKWAKGDGEYVKVGELLLEIESDKATVEVVAEKAGTLKILKPAGERILIGAVIAEIDESGKPGAGATPSSGKPASAAAPVSPSGRSSADTASARTDAQGRPLSPAVGRVVEENKLDPRNFTGTGKDGRLTKGDLLASGAPASASPSPSASPPSPAPAKPSDRPGDRRVPMTNLRARIADRLVAAQHTAAILTTFNEVDMTAVNAIRAAHKEAFKAKHGVSLSFMSFFSRASVEALKTIPEVNASIDGRDVVYHDYVDLGIAVGTERGLVVPILKSAEKMDFVAIEKKIAELALKARDGKLGIADLAGGTFTISNGGTYGSLLSTPILTPPQSGILGMHKIQDRPVAVAGKVEIRPMMYLALSYDHRLIDGKGAVTFLVTLKDLLENPAKLGFQY